jgi:hypothetical protein
MMALGVALSVPAVPAPVGAQVEAEAVLEGRVERASEALAGVTVSLHRVSADEAGEVDRVTADSAGRFRFRLPRVPDPGSRSEVFFGSVRHQGVLYFGNAISQASQLDSLYVINVYDTASAPQSGASLPVQVRTVVLEPMDEGWRVTDLLELRNDGDRTLVASPDGATWEYPLPPESLDHEVGDADVPAEGAEFSGTTLVIRAAIPPGPRLHLVRYRLPSQAASLPMPGSTERVELLVREPAPPLTVTGLVASPPLELEPGTTYRRFTAQNARDVMVTIGPGREPANLPLPWIAITLAMALAAVGLWATRRRPTAPPSAPIAPVPLSRSEVLLRVAKLDEAFEAGEDRTVEARQAYEAERIALLALVRDHPARGES